MLKRVKQGNWFGCNSTYANSDDCMKLGSDSSADFDGEPVGKGSLAINYRTAEDEGMDVVEKWEQEVERVRAPRLMAGYGKE
jgi:hypothetical protein